MLQDVAMGPDEAGRTIMSLWESGFQGLRGWVFSPLFFLPSLFAGDGGRFQIFYGETRNLHFKSESIH